jgi:hypothetical protein
VAASVSEWIRRHIAFSSHLLVERVDSNALDRPSGSHEREPLDRLGALTHSTPLRVILSLSNG